MKTLVVLAVLTATTFGVGVAHAGSDDTFCDLARQIGAQNLGLDGADDVDTAALLADIDRLDAVAPPDIADDFHYFDRFEHATLDPGAESGHVRAHRRPHADRAPRRRHLPARDLPCRRTSRLRTTSTRISQPSSYTVGNPLA